MSNVRPSSHSLVAIPAVLVLAIFPSSCFFAKKPPAAFTPPPPIAAPVFGAPEPLTEPPVVAELDLSNSSIDPHIVPNGFPEAPAPPPAKPAPKRMIATPLPKPPATVPPEAPTQPAPRLGQILSAEETRDLNRKLDESLERVRRVVVVLSKKNLTTDQAEILNRIQVFQKQAEEKREQDLVIAQSLARRADLLAKDLQDRVQ
jgi:hypothetical protein